MEELTQSTSAVIEDAIYRGLAVPPDLAGLLSSELLSPDRADMYSSICTQPYTITQFTEVGPGWRVLPCRLSICTSLPQPNFPAVYCVTVHMYIVQRRVPP